MTGKSGTIRKTALVLLLLLTVLWCLPVAGENTDEEEEFSVGLSCIEIYEEKPADAEELGVNAEAELPVYLAPFEDACRNGEDTVSVSESFQILASAGEWRMIEYAGGNHRIGWIHVPEAEREEYDDFPNDAALLRLTRDADLTDEPWGTRRTVTRLRQGDTVTGLASMEMDCLYVQTEVNGQTVWLFIEPDAVEAVPLFYMDKDILYIHEGVTRIGDAYIGWMAVDDEDHGREILVPLCADDLAVDGIDMSELAWDEDNERYFVVRQVIFPESVTSLGGESFVYGVLDELCLPQNLKYLSSYAFYGVVIRKLIIPAGCEAEITNYGFDRCDIGYIEVEEGNPLYSSRDGVLFNADGTVLLWYPDGKKDLHYDVPAGVVEIADQAFDSDEMDIPLQTITLPMGLRQIGWHAFSGCGRLNSLTVPLTVTELDENAFDYCVSLERLSLPPGLTYEKNVFAKYSDFTWFNGDNGTTKTIPGRLD